MTYVQPEDELVHRAQRGDREALDELCALCTGPVRAISGKITRGLPHRFQFDEVLSDAWLAFFGVVLPKWNGSVPFMAWLSFKLPRAIVDGLRSARGRPETKRYRRAQREVQFWPLFDRDGEFFEPGEEDRRLRRLEDVEELRQALHRVSPKKRAACPLAVTRLRVAGLKMHEIADALGITESRACQLLKAVRDAA